MVFKFSIRVVFFSWPGYKPSIKIFPNPFCEWQINRFINTTRHLELSFTLWCLFVNIDIILGGRR